MTIAHVISWTGAQGNGVTSVTTGAIDTTGANFIALTISSSLPVSSTADSKSNTYQNAIGPVAASTDDVYIKYAESPTVGSGHTITVNTPGGTFIAIGAAAYSGMLASATLDKTINAGGSGTALSSGATATTTTADQLVIGTGTVSTGGVITWTAGSGYTVRSQVTDASSGTINFLEDKIVGATGAQTITATCSASGAWECVGATFKGTAPAAGGAQAQQMLLGVGS